MSGSPKAALRRDLLAARRAVSPGEREAEAAALVAALPSVLAGVDDPVCLYVPVGTEPGVPPDAVRALGRRVLLPVVVGAAPLDWAEDTGSLVSSRLGLQEPTGPRLGPSAVASAGLVVVPALAVSRSGVRLGRGAGHYDRSLVLAGPSVRCVALVRDDELVDELPAEDHDVRMHGVWRPGHGVTALPTS